VIVFVIPLSLVRDHLSRPASLWICAATVRWPPWLAAIRVQASRRPL